MSNFKKIEKASKEAAKSIVSAFSKIRKGGAKAAEEKTSKFIDKVAEVVKEKSADKISARAEKIKEEVSKIVQPKSKNLLEGCKTYMIGCMEFKNGESWRLECASRLGDRGIVCFDPYIKPFDEKYAKEDSETQEEMKRMRHKGFLKPVHDHFKQIVATDLAMVDRSDFIVCYIDPKVPTFGTIHELVVAVQAKKPIFVFVERGVEHTPLWLLGLLPPNYFYDDLESLLLMIESIDDGETDIDSSRWRIFKKEYR